jgi:hypothetical protein
MNLTIRLFSFLLFTYSLSYGQMGQYDYKLELKGISQQWHKITLPDGVFGKTSQSLADIRVFGISKNNDTIEAPYLLKVNAKKTSRKNVAFKIRNTAHNDKGYYFTFEIPTKEPINQIELELKQENFDWQITLEGSQDQNEWFTVLENYRILSIKNELTNFQFNKLTFPSSTYRFFRLLIVSKEKPELIQASIAQHIITKGTFRNYPIKKINIQENKQSKQTEIDIELQLPTRASHIKIAVTDTFDYYRPVTIQYLSDSFKTEQGWKYNYSTLTAGTLNSIEENTFTFKSITLQKLKILVHNQDNQALSIDSIEVQGYVHELVARFTEPGTYFLTYGNSKAKKAHYDIDRFADKIPKNLIALETGREQIIEKETVSGINPLFENPNWLWAIMTVIILLLGWFSVQMMRKK